MPCRATTKAIALFGVRLARHRLQAVWIEVVNGGDEPLWLDRVQLDPGYYTPQEAANLAHFKMATRLVAFGVLGWLFLPLLHWSRSSFCPRAPRTAA